MRVLASIATRVVVGSVVALSLAVGGAHAQLCPELVEIGRELDALAAEIQLLTDLNTLQLTRAQIEALLPAVEELRTTAIGFEQQRVILLRQLKPLLEQKRALLVRDEQPPDALTQQIGAIGNELAALDQTAEEALTARAATFREILTEPQVAIITGEEDARRQVVELIDWVREMDDETFEREAPPYAEELAAPDVGLTAEEILDLLTLARAMSAEQYARDGDEIRGKLIELFRPAPEVADHIIVSVFLNPAMPKVLQDKLAVMPGP